MGDKPAMHRRLLEKFLINAQAQLSIIINAAATGDVATICHTAHALKSAARTVGAMQFGELCHELEKAGKAGDEPTCKALAERMNGTFATAAERILQAVMGASINPINPDNPLGAIRYDSPSTVRPELVEGLVPQRGMVRQAHHERSNGLSGINLNSSTKNTKGTK